MSKPSSYCDSGARDSPSKSVFLYQEKSGTTATPGATHAGVVRSASGAQGKLLRVRLQSHREHPGENWLCKMHHEVIGFCYDSGAGHAGRGGAPLDDAEAEGRDGHSGDGGRDAVPEVATVVQIEAGSMAVVPAWSWCWFSGSLMLARATPCMTIGGEPRPVTKKVVCGETEADFHPV